MEIMNNHPRNNCSDSSKFWSSLVHEQGLRTTAKAIGVDPKSIKRWISGEKRCSLKRINMAIDWILPIEHGWLPIYSPSIVIDGNTRVGGVSDYSRQAARGVRP
jgi:hypothetical protein